MDIMTGAGLAAPAGLNAYIPLRTVGLLARFTDLVTLNEPYDIIASDAGLIILTVLLVIELFADAIPGLDSVNDVIQSVIRPAAGAFLMLASDEGMLDMHPILQVIIGAGIAGAVHAVKALGRPAITVSTGGLGNPGVSSLENLLALVLSIMAILIPVAVLVGAVLLLILGIRWLLRRKSPTGTG
jgi:hypothetical protein